MEGKKWIERAHTFYSRMWVHAELRIASTREKRREKEKEGRKEGEKKVEDSVEGSGGREKFVTAKRNGGLWKKTHSGGEKKASARGDRIDFHCRLKIQWAAREREREYVCARDSRIENPRRGERKNRWANVENLFCPVRCANIRL